MKIRCRKETREQINRGISPAEVLDWVGDGEPGGAAWDDKTGSGKDSIHEDCIHSKWNDLVFLDRSSFWQNLIHRGV
jgi:hypothetical protein